MTTDKGKKLKVCDRVCWHDGVLGTVREVNYAAIKIEWDDGEWAMFPFHDPVPWSGLEAA